MDKAFRNMVQETCIKEPSKKVKNVDMVNIFGKMEHITKEHLSMVSVRVVVYGNRQKVTHTKDNIKMEKKKDTEYMHGLAV